MNSVYVTVCDALSHIVSRRAAENIVRDALRSAGTHPDRVTPREMQDLLRGTIFARLQQIIPVARARGEIKQLLARLDAMLRDSAARPLSPEVLEGLDALRAEFAPYANTAHPSAARLAGGIDRIGDAVDPVAALNALWEELAVLQMHVLTPRAPTLPPAAPAVPAAETEPHPAVTAILEPPAVTLAAAPTAADAGAIEGFDALDFSFDDPPAAPPAPPATAARRPLTPEDQETLMARFALEEGVTGVLLCDRAGNVHNARVNDGSPRHLAAVTAATVLLLERGRPFRVFYNNLSEASVFIAPLGTMILTVLADAHVNVGRVLSEVATVKEEV